MAKMMTTEEYSRMTEKLMREHEAANKGKPVMSMEEFNRRFVSKRVPGTPVTPVKKSTKSKKK